MLWNWQQSDWPDFTWDPRRLAKAEDRFLFGSGVFFGSFEHLHTDAQQRLAIEAISTEAVSTSAIEGDVLDRDSVQSSVQRQLGLTSDRRSTRPAERGIAEMLVDLYRNYASPLTDRQLFDWHRMVSADRAELRVIGGYRTRSEPMQVVSGRVYEPTVYFEAPPSSAIPAEMSRFIDWFNQTAPSGATPLPALTRAGIAHLYFVSIHPFEDGNGRVGRAIAEKSLAQHLNRPTLTAVAATILRHRAAYYDALRAANKHNQVTLWLGWFAGIILEAQQRTSSHVDYLIQKSKLLDRLRDRLNPRQSKVLLRMFQEGIDGFKGGLSAANYTSIARTSSATTTRDLADMVDMGALTRTGRNRATRYHLPFQIKPVPEFHITEQGDISA